MLNPLYADLCFRAKIFHGALSPKLSLCNLLIYCFDIVFFQVQILLVASVEASASGNFSPAPYTRVPPLRVSCPMADAAEGKPGCRPPVLLGKFKNMEASLAVRYTNCLASEGSIFRLLVFPFLFSKFVDSPLPDHEVK